MEIYANGGDIVTLLYLDMRQCTKISVSHVCEIHTVYALPHVIEHMM